MRRRKEFRADPDVYCIRFHLKLHVVTHWHKYRSSPNVLFAVQ